MPDTLTALKTEPPVVAEPITTPVPVLSVNIGATPYDTDLPQLRLDRMRSVQISITHPGLMSLVGQKVTDQTIQMAMTYVNQAFSEYCATNNVRPANILGHAQHVNQHVVEHVCHDQTSDGF